MSIKELKNQFHFKNLATLVTFICLGNISLVTFFLIIGLWKKVDYLKSQVSFSLKNETDLRAQLASTYTELTELKNKDEFLIKKNLDEEIKNIQRVYQSAVSTYEKLLDFKGPNKKTDPFDELFSKALLLLSDRKYASAEAVLVGLNKKIEAEKQKVAEAFKIPENVPADNKPPAGGYRRQKVTLDISIFLVDIASADLGSTRVIVDTASDSDCADNCPVLSLGEYISRSGAYAGVNGSYFCPATYPQCASKKNSFDTLLMNKKKYYFNSSNNVYSTVPAVIFSGNSARFVTQSLEWGRDTNVDAVIANQPLLVFNSKVAFGGSSDPKQGSKGNRSFIGATGSLVYIGVVHNATVAESARVLQSLGMDHALNLDDGGSTALWYGGYKVGPGRNIPNAVLFVKK
jgi:hypothetical protein